MLNVHSASERFSDICGVRECQEFRQSVLLMRRLASSASERFSGWNAQHENGVSSIIRFSENADEFISRLKRRVEGEIRECGQFGRQAGPQLIKDRLRRDMAGMVFNGIYRMQYELACMSIPPVEGGKSNGVTHHISEMFKASNDESPKLGEFLDSVNVPREEYAKAVETLRAFFLSRGPTNAEIREDKEKLSSAFISFMEGYVDFSMGRSPMSEGIVK